MLSPADAALVARDPDLPGLAVLLDDDAVASLVGAPVVRRYLRYKPGTSCVLGATAELPEGPADVLVTAYDGEGAAKLAKTAEGAPAGSVLASDPLRGLLAVTAAADRDLPALAVLADLRRRRRLLRRLLPDVRHLRSARLTTLSSKPMRRWVGLLTVDGGAPVVLRAYRPADARAATTALRALAGDGPRTPRLLAADEELGLLVTEYLPGRPLDALLAADAVTPSVLAAAGGALACLHDRPPSGLPAHTAADAAAAVAAAAGQVAVLLPDLAEPAVRLADQLAARLAGLPAAPVAVHGDFSADQVVVDRVAGVALLDLDRAATGDAAADLAGLYAALVSAQTSAGRTRPDPLDVLAEVLAGYSAVRPVPAPDALGAYASALLLRRVVDPFRQCDAGWPAPSRVLLEAAVEVGSRGLGVHRRRHGGPAQVDPLSLSPVDLLGDVVGTPVALDVLKDKPGRRRTSRATGPDGTAIVKVYASARAPVVAARVGALRHGPAEPVVPRVLLCDEPRHVLVLSEVPGTPYREALLAGDTGASSRVGTALGGWHAAHRGQVPAALRAHSVDREVSTLLERAATAPTPIADAVRRAVPVLAEPWEAVTVVHRDLYEEQVVLGAQVGLLDLDDAAAGPGELDLGNLLAHLRLLSLRTGTDLGDATSALLTAYADVAPLDRALLDRCEALSLLRLACLHRDERLIAAADERVLMGGSRGPHAATGG